MAVVRMQIPTPLLLAAMKLFLQQLKSWRMRARRLVVSCAFVRPKVYSNSKLMSQLLSAPGCLVTCILTNKTKKTFILTGCQ